MYLLYSFLLTFGAILLSPLFAFLILTRSKYRANLKQRFGFLSTNLKTNGRPTIWIHAVSVGETLASRPLVAALKERLPDYRIVISTTTVTGQAVARKHFGAHSVFHFPFDFGFVVRRTLSIINPKLVILMESELWPRFLYECRKRQIPVIVGNGRMSDRSFRGYQRAYRWAKRMFDNIALWLMQSPDDAGRIRTLGVPATKVKNLGNLKYDLEISDESTRDQTAASLADSLGFTENTSLIIAGSTTTGEETIILEAFRKLRQVQGLEKTRLLIAPRHPERFDEVANIISSQGFNLVRRSDHNTSLNADIVLLDTIGELAASYRFASLVFVGGSLIPKGGHNILEPAVYGKAIVVGPHMDNFRQILADFIAHNAVVQLPKLEGPALSEALASKITELMLNESVRHQLGERAHAVMQENRGAAARCADEVAAVLGKIPASVAASIVEDKRKKEALTG